MKITSQQLFRSARYLLVELFIVFIGVYLAFQLNAYHAERQIAERRLQLREALAQEIDVFLLGADHVLPRLDSLYGQWRQRFDAGEQPRPLTYQLGGIDLPPRGMWQAVVASDGIAILSVETMQTLSVFYSALDLLLNKYADLNSFSEQQLVPVSNSDAFYLNGQLRPEFVAYMQRLQDMLMVFEDVKQLALQSQRRLANEVSR